MTDIPFIARLGDVIEAAIAEPAPRRSRLLRRSTFVVVAAAVALAAGAVALAYVLSSPEELATRNVACYATANLGSDVTVVANEGSPVAACAAAYRQMGRNVPPLVACASKGSVAVIPGAGVSDCARLHLQPLPRGYAESQARTARLERGIFALEDAQDCIVPGTLADSVQRLLDSSGWTGWKAEVRSDVGAGPCGAVSGLDGAGRRHITGALDPDRRVVMVTSSAARSTMRLLYGPNGLARGLEDASGTRCFTRGELETIAAARAGAANRSSRVEVTPPLGRNVTLADSRAERYRDGCAIVTDVRPAADGRNVVVEIPRPA